MPAQHDRAIEKLFDALESLQQELAVQSSKIAVIQYQLSQQKSSNAAAIAFVTSIVSSVIIAAALHFLKLNS